MPLQVVVWFFLWLSLEKYKIMPQKKKEFGKLKRFAYLF
jgi:hypothetical protein